MMTLAPWRRQDELTTLRKEMSNLFERFFDGEPFGRHLPEVFSRGLFPRVNVSESETVLQVEAELPGMSEKEIDVQLMGHLLVISGERKWEEEKKTKEYHRMESEYGSFRREIPLPEGLRLSPDDITARYNKGILRIEVPKLEPTPTSHIKVKAG